MKYISRGQTNSISGKRIYKKIWIFFIVLFIMLLIFISLYRLSTTPEEITAHYKERWGVELPVPNEIINVWSTKYPARGDGEWVTELLYDSKVNPEQLHDFIKVTEGNLIEANRPVSHFISRGQNMYKIQQDEEFKITIEAYSTKVEPGDFYFQLSENGQSDTFTAIYQQTENRILLFEWHQ